MARILVVEDNPQNLKLVSVILGAEGHAIVPAMNATEAEVAVAQGVPDLILMDLALPGKDGYTLTRELRARPDTAKVPILALSAFAMPGDAEKALVAGCSAYLTKPVRRAPLLEHVARLLGSPGAAANPGVAPGDPPAAASSAPRRAVPAAEPSPVEPAADSPGPSPGAGFSGILAYDATWHSPASMEGRP
jgi:CheY-like chemotaxis protein